MSSSSLSNAAPDPSHPLYLPPFDAPRVMLVSTLFPYTSYGEGKEGMLISFSTKNKIQLIDGTLTKPTANSENFTTGKGVTICLGLG